MTTVVVDIGNARIKWARAEAGRLRERDSALHAGDVDGAIDALVDSLAGSPVERFVVANVAEDAVAAKLESRVKDRFGLPVELVQTAAETLGVRCAYRDPSRLGVDRWVSVIAGYRAAAARPDGPRPACVINAGTALTFDAVDVRGRHLGGLILAGPRLAADALARHTHRIGTTPPAGARPSGLGILGRSTEDAVGFGALIGPAAAFDRAAEIVSQELGIPAVVYLAGGEADVLRPWLETEVQVAADWVLKGLSRIDAQTPPGGAAPAGGPATN